jgi:membrane-associated phospholipid phosphatase
MTILEASPGGLAERIGTRFHKRHPVLIASMVTVLGYVMLALLMAGIGLLLTHVLQNGPVGRWDTRVTQWFVARRTPTRNTWTRYGSILGGTGTVVGIGAVATALLAIARRWREVGLLFFGLILEVTVFVTTTFLVNRPRPIDRLDPSPRTSSFPSGHTAAAIVLFIGLAIVISILVRNVLIRALVWIIALLLPIAVGVSRAYRGMHHPTDVLASVILGTGCLVVTIVAVRSASVATRPSSIEAEPVGEVAP